LEARFRICDSLIVARGNAVGRRNALNGTIDTARELRCYGGGGHRGFVVGKNSGGWEMQKVLKIWV
jgi:hypothetical protein